MSEFRKKMKQFEPFFGELCERIYSLTIFFAASCVVGFFISGPLIKAFTRIFTFENVILTTTAPFQLVDLAMSIGIFFGIICFVPFFLYHFYSFIGAGLKSGEKKLFFLFLPAALGLFVSGFAYCFYILYYAMDALAGVNTGLGIANLWDLGSFLTQILTTSAILGFIFEFPVILTTLVRFGFITIESLKAKRRYVIFGLAVGAAFLPPTDGLSLILMVVPLVFLYEITIFYNVLRYRKLT